MVLNIDLSYLHKNDFYLNLEVLGDSGTNHCVHLKTVFCLYHVPVHLLDVF